VWVWVPKYRYRVLEGQVAEQVFNRLHMFAEHKGCEVVDLNVQRNNVHMLAMVPPQVTIWDLM